MDNGTLPVDTQPPADTTAPVSPAVTGPGEPGTPAPAAAPAPSATAPVAPAPAPEPKSPVDQAAGAIGDTASKVRQNVANLPVLSLVLGGLAAIGAFVLVKRSSHARKLEL